MQDIKTNTQKKDDKNVGVDKDKNLIIGEQKYKKNEYMRDRLGNLISTKDNRILVTKETRRWNIDDEGTLIIEKRNPIPENEYIIMDGKYYQAVFKDAKFKTEKYLVDMYNPDVNA